MQDIHENHKPVMLEEVLENIGELENRLIVDATFGAGGYSRAFLERGARVIGLDRDPQALCAAKKLLVQKINGKLKVFETVFSDLDKFVEEKPDAIIFDIGVSSMQIDQAERGFSFLKDGPLDMRMSGKGLNAAKVINCTRKDDLAQIFFHFGEERYAKRIASMIDNRRRVIPFTRTVDLAESIEKLIGRRSKNIHPATRVFQALRIYVNNELEELAKALFAAEKVLKPGGKLIVVSFHSLEDRIVKRFLQNCLREHSFSRYSPDINRMITKEKDSTFLPCFKGVKVPRKEEIEKNSRARSAKMRVAVRTDILNQRKNSTIYMFTPLIDFREIMR